MNYSEQLKLQVFQYLLDIFSSHKLATERVRPALYLWLILWLELIARSLAKVREKAAEAYALTLESKDPRYEKQKVNAGRNPENRFGDLDARRTFIAEVC